MKDTVCIYSGGMDSFTMVNDLYYHSRLYSCLSFNYGQRHVKELQFAKAVCQAKNIEHRVIDLRDLGSFLDSALTSEGRSMPEGHYAEESMKQTVVPNRNMIMLSIAAAYSMSRGVPRLAFGAHAGDHTIYPDCRTPFVYAMNATIAIGNWGAVEIVAPYIDLDKSKILNIGINVYNLDYSQSWTCYKGGAKACGKCGSCQERLEAFASHGVVDPLEYE